MLDTTYCAPRWSFPPQSEAVSAMAEFMAAEAAAEPGAIGHGCQHGMACQAMAWHGCRVTCWHAMPKRKRACRAMPCRAMPCHAMPCQPSAMPCHAMRLHRYLNFTATFSNPARSDVVCCGVLPHWKGACISGRGRRSGLARALHPSQAQGEWVGPADRFMVHGALQAAVQPGKFAFNEAQPCPPRAREQSPQPGFHACHPHLLQLLRLLGLPAEWLALLTDQPEEAQAGFASSVLQPIQPLEGHAWHVAA